MYRRAGVLIAGLALGLGPAIAAYGANTISVKDVSTFRGSGMHFTADVVYRCDRSTNAKGIDYDIRDSKTGANGHGLANYPVCDGKEHAASIPGESDDGGQFNRGDQATVHIWMSNTHMDTVPGADTAQTLTLQ